MCSSSSIGGPWPPRRSGRSRRFEAEPGLKFDKIYPVYSQRFQQTDFGEDEKFDPNVMPNTLLTDPKLGDAFVYVSTDPADDINLFGEEAVLRFGEGEAATRTPSKLDIPIHAFDLIVADECHRGYSAKELSVWRNTLDWFDAIKIGLTATPAAHTMAYFENMVYRYDYERAVREGYLVDYDVVRINSRCAHERRLPPRGRAGRPGRHRVRATANSTCSKTSERSTPARSSARSPRPTPTARSSKRSSATPRSTRREHGRFPKTLIFAVNDLPHTSHADQLVDQARDVFGRGEAFVGKITGRVDRPLQKIREFRNRPNPRIVVTVDLLTTGVDIPDLEFIVFLRPVKSRILFEQMLGRGTRLGATRAPARITSPSSTASTGRCFEYFRERHRHDGRAARGRRQVRSSRSSRRSGRTRTATTTSSASSATAAHRQER